MRGSVGKHDVIIHKVNNEHTVGVDGSNILCFETPRPLPSATLINLVLACPNLPSLSY